MIKKTAGNSTYPKNGISCFEESIVDYESSAFCINICAENPAHRKPASRYIPF